MQQRRRTKRHASRYYKEGGRSDHDWYATKHQHF